MAKRKIVDLTGDSGAALLEELKKRKAFGVSLTHPEVLVKPEEIRAWEKNGWLGVDGICKFPETVKATPSGAIYPMLPASFWETATEEEIRMAVDTGLILFVDGNGVARTKNQYLAVYSQYPDPELVLRITGRFPPGAKKRFIRIGRWG